ncbi:hypothetical protein L218DRAFT_596782 [Marasmius fiardii PR-910]|nr:hypothetical protein L218DRAFT_596782 [Marasmius fiardii PR-910]
MPPPRSISEAPSTVHRADLFFSSEPSSSSSRIHAPPRHSFSTSPNYPVVSRGPTLHRSRTAPAPIPPPPLPPPPLPRTQQRIPSHPDFPKSPAIPPLPPPPISESKPPIHHNNDESELEAAIKLSQTESAKQALALEKLTNQEEEDLARALEESLRTSRPESFPSLSSSSASNSLRTSSAVPLPVTPPAIQRSISASERTPVNTTSRSMHDDEALARQLAEQEAADVRSTPANKFARGQL